MKTEFHQLFIPSVPKDANWYAFRALQRGKYTFHRYLTEEGWETASPLYADKETIEKLAAVHEDSFVPPVTTREYDNEMDMESWERMMERY